MEKLELRRAGLAWNYHDEAIYLAKRKFESGYQSRTGQKWINSGLWVLEDDVDWSGNWNELLNKYSKADFVSSDLKQKTFTKQLKVKSSEKFQQRFVLKAQNATEGYVLVADEHVVKYSARFEIAMHQAMEDGCHAHSEYGTATIATKLGFRVEELDQFETWDDESEDYRIKSWTRGDNKEGNQRELMKKHFEARRREGRAILFHPCKW
uniref:Uncharacterized protein n=2 Tax=Lotharella globosa TaxID=91324 RepID=A0A7S3YZ78_9EUKA